MANTLLYDTPKSDSSLKDPAKSERRMPLVMALVFLPWMAVIFITAGWWAAANFLGYAIIVFATGYSIISATLPASSRSQAIVLAPAAGILAISALTAFWVRLGLPVIWAPVLWFVLALAGVLGLWRDRARWAKTTVAYGLVLAFFSALICMVYFLPSARNDLVERRDGSFNWSFMDSQHFHAIAASIKDGGSPPKTPGTATAELFYHFGPYAPAAAISRLDGLDLGDALARVTRGASIWALVLSCFGLGTLLSLKANGRKFGGIISVAGLFFYGSLMSLFTDELTGSGRVTRAVLFNIPGLGVLGDGGPFVYLLVGHSLLHGLGAITAVMGLCLLAMDLESGYSWGILILLPALAVPVNSVAALYCVGVACILLFWGRLKSKSSWLLFLLMLCLFIAAWKIMGFSHAPDAERAMFNEHAASQWWMITVWFIVGLGFRLVSFRWISRPLKDPLSALVLTTIVGFLAFSLLFQLRDGNEKYGIHYLQSILSIFAFSRLTSDCWRSIKRTQWVEQWLKVAKWGLIILLVCGVLLRVIVYIVHSQVWVASVSAQILPCCLLILLFAGTLAMMKRSRRFSAVASAILMGVLMIGFLAWTTDWLRHAMGGVNTNITYAPGEVHGLRRLGELMAPGDRFATNKHTVEVVDSILPPIERSYGYSALSERPVLLEGYLDRGENLLPWFDALLHDNELMFSTTDPETLHDVAQKWHVRWLAARPGTDISLPKPLPAWLVEQPDSGELKIYRID
jgi:hypothetical protein